MILRNIQLDTALPGSQRALYARQGDSRVYTLAVSLCERTVPLALPREGTAVFRGKKPDGTLLLLPAAMEGDLVKVYLGGQAFTASGIVKCQVDIFRRWGGAAVQPAF